MSRNGQIGLGVVAVAAVTGLWVWAGMGTPDAAMDRDTCIQRYAVNGATDLIVRAGYFNCSVATSPDASAADRARALCIVRGLPDLHADLGLRAYVQRCAAQ